MRPSKATTYKDGLGSQMLWQQKLSICLLERNANVKDAADRNIRNQNNRD